MRVLHVHSGNIFGGIETVLLTFARERKLCPSMETSFALCFEGRLRDELIAADATIHNLGAVRLRDPLSVRRARRNLKLLLRQESFDVAVVHSCWSQAVFGPTVRTAGVPLAFYLHDAAKGNSWLERLAGRTKPNLMICNSDYTAATAQRLYRAVQSTTMFYPVAPPRENGSSSSRESLRSELETVPEATVIIQVSRMEEWKGHVRHLEALAMLKDVPGWVCWQVGGAQTTREQDYYEGLKRLADGLGIADRVRFTGQRREISFANPTPAPNRLASCL
jgi:glycosyltransferase involved in cell wall biosynthesis